MSGTEIAVRRDTDSWTTVLPAVGDLASKIAETEFVPKALRGKGPAVAACILTGREIGIPPMQALSSIHVVDGRPTLSAELMRQLVFAAGHQIRYPETTNTRCVVEGYRAGSESPDATVTWSMDDAKRAGLDGKNNWRKHPRQMLIARATAELCRMVFPDVIGGLAYTQEELTEGGVVDDEDAPAAPANGTKRRARRKSPVKGKAATTGDAPKAEAPIVDEPPLDDEPAAAPTDEEQDPGWRDDPSTRDQHTALHAAFGEIGWTERDDKLRACSTIAARSISSSADLTKGEASDILDVLAQAQATNDPAVWLTDLLEATTPREDDIVDAELVEDTR